MSIFKKRALAARFTLDAAAGTFTSDGKNTVDVSGVRMRASLVNNMSTTMDSLELEVWGLPLAIMNKLTILQNGYTQGIQNQVELTAGDGQNMSLIFSGQIFTAWADFSGQPEGVFILQAFSCLSSAYASVPPLSYKGVIDAATVANSIALQMTPPLTLHNSGVNVQLHDVALPGDAMQQLRKLARMADFQWSTDEMGVLAIWPRGKPRDTLGLDINQDTGLVGFPSYNDKGIAFSTIFNPSLRVNGPVNIYSASSPANGVWYPFNVTHDLESEMPDGRWFSHVEAQRFTGQGDQATL